MNEKSKPKSEIVIGLSTECSDEYYSCTSDAKPDESGGLRGRSSGEDDNLIIHGDNLDAPKALLPCYAHRVKGIYIDPLEPVTDPASSVGASQVRSTPPSTGRAVTLLGTVGSLWALTAQGMTSRAAMRAALVRARERRMRRLSRVMTQPPAYPKQKSGGR